MVEPHATERESSSDEYKALKLTPHTLRLIRLITSPTSSSIGNNDHTQHAIALLSKIASKSHPFLLWDILARLYASLTDASTFRAGGDDDCCLLRRECIALAMEHVAMYIPVEDRRHFMMDPSSSTPDVENVANATNVANVANATNATNEKMWLTVQDLLPAVANPSNKSKELREEENWVNLDQVLQNGRLLLSSCGTQYDYNVHSYNSYQLCNYEKEEAMLSSLDTSALSSTSVQEKNELLTERLALQRKILASRLGFGGVLSMNINTKDIVTDEDLSYMTAHKNLKHETSQTKISVRERNLLRLEKRKRMDHSDVTSAKQLKRTKCNGKVDPLKDKEEKEDVDDDEDEGEKLTIRNILLLSLSQQLYTGSKSHHTSSRKNLNTRPSESLSHQTPQNILATDMVFNSVHPSWHVRHGSLLGLLALLKSWKHTSNKKDEAVNPSIYCFGKWPHDILTRCLCIFALDRFGDYSGSTITTKESYGPKLDHIHEKVVIGAAMTAPVREVAARVLSFLLEMAPKNQVQKPTYRVLVKLSECQSEWEVRHGAMLGFKSVAQAMIGRQNHNKIAPYQHLDTVWNNISSHAFVGLKDPLDDVKAVSAQVLNCFVHNKRRQNDYVLLQLKPENFVSYAKETWVALKQVQTTSSCTLDLLNLFSSMVSNECNVVLNSMGVLDTDVLLQKMNDFLYFDDRSVRLRCFESLSLISEPIASAFLREDSKTRSRGIQLYCDLIVNLFDSYMNDQHNTDEQMDEEVNKQENDLESDKDLINVWRDDAWVAVIDASMLLTNDENLPLIHETIKTLLFRFINIDFSRSLQENLIRRNTIMHYDIKSKTSRYFQNLHRAANAFIEYYNKFGNLVDADSTITIFVLLLVESPLIEFCEAGCILLTSVALSKKDKYCTLISKCSPIFLEMLQQGATCMRLHCHEESKSIQSDESFLQRCTKTLLLTMTNVTQHKNNLPLSSKIWSNVLIDSGIELDKCSLDMKKKSKQHMRLLSSISGTIISFGPNYLPTKITSLIRSFVTSIKNEDAPFRAKIVCEDLVHIIHLLRESSKVQVVDKIVGNICKLASYDPQMGHLPNDFTKCGLKSSKKVLRLLITSIPQNGDLTYEKKVWEILKCLTNNNPASTCQVALSKALVIIGEISCSFKKETKTYAHFVSELLPNTILLSCRYTGSFIRQKAVSTTTNVAYIDPLKSMPVILPLLVKSINASDDDAQRLGACDLMSHLVERLGVSLLPFVQYLLPVAMSMITDPVERCSKSAASTFAKLVRLAPLVSTEKQDPETYLSYGDESFRQVVDHLIHGKSLPPLILPSLLSETLTKSGIKLRNYQKEGVAWMSFLRTLNLNGALVDEMGLGKTLQAL